MKKIRNRQTGRLVIAAMLLFALTWPAFAVPLVRTASGANTAALQPVVDLFRSELGGVNNGVGNSFSSGRREIDWDGLTDASSAPNFIVNTFFNFNSPRGVIFTSDNFAINPANLQQPFQISASASSGVPVRFGNIEPSYSATFTTFSSERLFTAIGTNSLEVQFFVPGTRIPATVSGFGMVFSDVDLAGSTGFECYDVAGNLMNFSSIPAAPVGPLSFIGVLFQAGERIARVRIHSGNAPLKVGNIDGGNPFIDVVAMDDLIFAEPRALGYHTADFDGDGTTDFSVFRPTTGSWYVLSSGTNTFNGTQFGQSGDIPVDGDFDGDSRSDIAVFRPGNGAWYILRSGTGQFSALQFGQNGDRPVPGDYDKDGKTDIAVYRPAAGSWFYLRSSDGAFQAIQWGANGDIPLPASPQ
ncbi:MAG: VCBS repeat-containing protein [Pyrinomonadaceae bacterium]